MVNPAAVAHGPALIGLFFNILLLGIMMTQTFLYFSTFKNDKGWMKAYVALLFVADLMNSMLDCVWMYQSLIIHFADAGYLAKADWAFAADPAMTGIIAGLVQLFFAWRIKVLTGSWPLLCIVVSCALAGCLGGIGTTIAVTIIPSFVHFQEFKAIVVVWLVSNAVCDVVITTALTWHLRRHRTGFPATDDIVNKIIRMTVQTGMITAIVAILDVCFFLSSTTGLHLVFNFPLSKLYTNSLMSTLNSRSGWKYNASSDPSRDEGRSLSRTPGHGTRAHGVIINKLSQGHSPEVFVQVESHQMADMDNMDNKAAADSFFPDHDDVEDAPARKDIPYHKGNLKSPQTATDESRTPRSPASPYSG